MTIAVAIVVAACFSYASSGWLKYKSPTDKDINAVTFVNDDTGWAVGTNGTIYEYRNFPGVEPASVGRIKALMR